MIIEFENERELIDGIIKSGVDVFRFAILYLDRFDVVLNKTSQSKIANEQNKLLLENLRFEDWKVGKSELYSEGDLPDFMTSGYRDSTGQPIRRLIKDIVGDLSDPRNRWRTDFAVYRGEYHFTYDGLITIGYRAFHDGYTSKEEYTEWYHALIDSRQREAP